MSKVIFDGVGNMPELQRITSKKNYASSSQSHKMGATAAFNDILHYLAKEKYPDLANEVGGRVAVYQHPVYGFEKKLVEGTTDQYDYKFIGLYTTGADKGDKGYFGFDQMKSTAIRLEGTDHLKGVGFNYPWQVNGVRKIRYNAAKEALCIVTGTDATKWTAILEQSACGSAKTEAEIDAYLEQEFRPAYECAYNNNPLIVGVDMTLDTINGNIDAFNRMRREDDRPYSYCEFWIDGEYDLYYFDQETNRYEKNGINLLHNLGISEDSLAGKTLAEKNKLFIEARVARFKAEAENYFCKNDALLQLVFLYIIAASDNGEKNMYPYKMGTLASGSRWRFLQDDLDSIFSTDNQGQDTKPYGVELHDFTDDSKSAYYFKGEDSALWQLVEMAWPNEMRQMGHDILQAMYDLSSKGTKTTDKLMGFFDDYFFSRAQEYFTPSAYNNDTEYSYEEAWNNKEYVASVDIHPLAQALGAHLTTERAWLSKRMVYLMSKYGFGGYASNEDTALGIISVRTQVAQGFTLTPAIDSYPTILGGQSQFSSAAERVKAGTPIALAPVGGGNTNTYIVGADFLSDIGDLKDLSIDPSSVVTLSVASKRLRRLKVGDENPEEVTSYLATLAIQRCDSLETVDARNLTTLVGTVDLTQCPRLTEALFDGTNATAVIIAAGSKVEKLHLPDTISTIDLRDTKFLSDFEIGTLANLRFLRLEGVPIVNGFAMLKEAYNTDGQQLKDIRLVGFEYDGTADDLDMIANLANDLDKDGNPHLYNGIDAQGNPTNGNPILEGKLNIDGYVYEDTANIVKQQYPTIEFTPKGYYIRFADPVVQSICATNFGDGTGLTKEDAAKVATFLRKFRGNTEIKSFDESIYFTSVKILNNDEFNGCSSLERIDLSNIESIGGYCFLNCENLVVNFDYPQVKSIGAGAFSTCTVHIVNMEGVETYSGAFRGNKVTGIVNAPNIKGTVGSFADSLITQVLSLGMATGLGGQAFARCKYLEKIILPPTLKSIGQQAFQDAPLANTENNISEIISNVTETGYEALVRCGVYIEDVRLDSLETMAARSFEGCDIRKVSNTGKVASIGERSFYNNSNLNEANISEHVTQIGNYAFSQCRSLKTVILKSVVPPSIGTTIFSNTHADLAIYVPDQSVSAYRGAAGWSAYADRILPMEAYLYGYIKFADPAVEAICLANWDTNGSGYLNKEEAKAVTSIGTVFKGNTEITSFEELAMFTGLTETNNWEFSGCTNLGSISLPTSLATISTGTFNGCSSLTAIDIPNGVTTIGIQAFYNCKGLIQVNIPSSVTKIDNSCFENDSALTSVTLSEGLLTIGANAFTMSKAAKILTIPSTVISIGERAFDRAYIQNDIVIPSGVTTIATQSFAGNQFGSVTILGNITSIANNAFIWCSNLKRVIIPNTVTPPTLGTSVFTDTNAELAIYVPDASVDAYKAKENWSTYADRIKPLSQYVES